jgi:hypothetical protein
MRPLLRTNTRDNGRKQTGDRNKNLIDYIKYIGAISIKGVLK